MFRKKDDVPSPQNKRELFYDALAEFVKARQGEVSAKKRRWAIIIMLMVGYMGFNVWFMLNNGELNKVPLNYAAVVRIDGPIQIGKSASTQVLFPALEDAFEDDDAKCVAIVVNSPGGMVGQSEMLHNKIAYLAKKHDRKVIAVGEDLMASGGYMIAVSAPTIHAPRLAAVGSVGVRIDSYDLTGLAEKFGIGSRTLTAGGMKDTMNPLLPLTPEAEAKINHDLAQIHEEFKRIVKDSRGDRVSVPDEEVFNGAVFTGLDAKRLGLIDGFLPLEQAVKEECGADGVKAYDAKLGVKQLLGVLENF